MNTEAVTGKKCNGRWRLYDTVCLFAGYRIDKHTVKARSDKEAKNKTRNQYKKKYRREVTGIRIENIREVE